MDNKGKIDFKSKKVTYILLALLSAVFVTLLILPSDFFDEGQSMCLSVLLADTECYACGMTRAVQHMIHLDFEAAAEFNKLSFLVVPLIVFIILNHIYQVFFKK